MEQGRDDLGRMTGLSESDLDMFFEMIREGQRASTAAKWFGCSGQAFSNRKRRDEAFRVRYMRAEAEAERNAVRKLRQFEEPPGVDAEGKPQDSKAARGEWVPIAWFLERRFGWNKPHEKAQAAKLRRESRQSSSDSDLDRQRAIRAFVESARHQSEGDPNATASMPDNGDPETQL